MYDLTALRALVFDSLSDQIAVIDHAGTIVDVNSAWISFGNKNGLCSEYSCLGRNYLEILSVSVAAEDSLSAEVAQGVLDVVGGKRVCFSFEYPCHSPDDKRWFMMGITGLKDKSARLFVISHHNITLRKLAEERAEYLAMKDALTGLANRRHFDLFLNSELRRRTRDGSAISLIVLDVDYFKKYNDEFGHPAGDQCLVKVSQTLLGFSRRPSDLAARLGGDEFALILGNSDFAEARKISAAILRAIHDLRMFFRESGQVTASIGVASMIPRERQNGDLLYHEADKALYRAKVAGRNCVVHVQLLADKQPDDQ
jgi:diguanylate cyclase (GGDEF)-like protein